jgi:hypothetical protein
MNDTNKITVMASLPCLGISLQIQGSQNNSCVQVSRLGYSSSSTGEPRTRGSPGDKRLYDSMEILVRPLMIARRTGRENGMEQVNR